jgi:hypothetical protein
MGKMLDEIIGVDEAAELWGLSAGYIKNLCAEKKIIAKKIGNVWVIDKRQPNPSKKRIKEPEYDEVKAKFQKFVQDFFSGEPGTEKEEMLPNFWTVTNKKHDFHATIKCEYRVKDLQTMEKEWYAIVTQLDKNGKQIDKREYALEFEESAE